MSIRTLKLFPFLIFSLSTSLIASTRIPNVHAVYVHHNNRASKRVITQPAIAKTGANSLADVLKNMGGLQLISPSGSDNQAMISMRGFGANASSNSLLLINGIPITNPDLAPPNLNMIPLADIERIEINAGSESVLYGDQAVGGTINLITNAQLKPYSRFSCGAGSYQSKQCAFGAAKKQDFFSYTVNGTLYESQHYRDHNQDTQANLNGNFSSLDNNLVFDYQLAKELLQFPGALTAQQVRQNRQQSTNQTDYFNDWDGVFHLKYRKQLTDHWRARSDFSHRAMHGKGVFTSSFSQSRTTDFVKPVITYVTEKSTNTSGIDLQQDTYELSSAYGISATKQQKFSVFDLFNYSVNDQLTIDLGARGALQTNRLASNNSTNYLNRAAVTTIGANYFYDPKTQYYIRRAGSFRFPKADEDAAIATDVTSLRTQRGVSYETGVSKKFPRVTTDLQLYQLNLRDEIAFDPLQTQSQPFGSNRNLAPTVRRGLSLSLQTVISDKTLLNTQLNTVDARFQSGANSGNRIPLVSENIFLTGIHYQFTDHFSTYAEGLFTGSQYASNDNQNIAGKLGGYTIFNLNFHYYYRKISADFRINNIFNKYYYLYSVYQSSNNLSYFYPAATRNVMLNLGYDFS